MKHFLPLAASLVLLILFQCSPTPKNNPPVKPEGDFDYAAFESDPEAKARKQEYLNDLYFANPDTDVEGLKARTHRKNRLLKSHRKRGFQDFANGKISAEWFERGSDNEAGDIREVDYNPSNDDLFVMSTAGHIWKGNLDGRKWALISDQERFNTNILAHAIPAQGVDRVMACFGSGEDYKKLRYSDDDGATWTIANGFNFYDHWGSPKMVEKLSDGKTIFFLTYTWISNPWGAGFEIYRSDDFGANFTKVLSIDGGGYGGDDVTMWQYPKSDQIVVYDTKEQTRYLLDHNGTNLQTTVTGPQNLTGTTIPKDDLLATGRISNNTHYIMTNRRDMFKSFDGLNWFSIGQTMINGSAEANFRNGFLANPNNTELYTGGFQFYKTSDDANWTQQYNYWWTYYDRNLSNQKDYMHVDIMDTKYFEKGDQTPFIIILNHAGVYVSYDNMATTSNLGLDGLNVITLYDHATASDGSIYCGAQDKGTFSNTNDNDVANSQITTDNQTTGDGMRELFFNNGASWFGMLQNGFMMCKPDKTVIGGYRSWDVPGSHTAGWINPMENHPDPAAKKCYVAGGNITGGTGSYLIEMNVSFDANGGNFQWSPNQYNYDFRANSNNGTSVIKAIGASKADHSRIYVATHDATFFSSTNSGASWTKSNFTIPSSLIPWDIATSDTDPDKVWICGTGWSNDGVYYSSDQGANFAALSTDIPSATFFDIALSPTEDALYAATSEGPYVYWMADQRWYYLADAATPEVDFRSVEYIQEHDIVRFGTYGRGLLDFVIEPLTTGILSEKSKELTISPNPASDFISIDIEGQYKLSAFSSTGDLRYSITDQSSKLIDIRHWDQGLYIIKVESDEKTLTSKLLIE